MKVLVTGACGQLGRSIADVAGEYPEHFFVFTDVTGDGRRLDITSPEDVREVVLSEGIEAIVNCAAYTDVEASEDNPALAEKLNSEAVGVLARAMKEVDGLLIHISTDYVFGGNPVNTPITEDVPPAPLGAYGMSKYHGEQEITASGVRYVILRSSWLYSPYGRNFVKTMLRLISEKPVVNVVFDQVGTPTCASDLVSAIMAVLANPVPGIYNYSNEGVCSWYDFTRAIASFAGNDTCDIRPCHSSEFPSKVHRPAYSVLDKTLFKKTYGVAVPYWTDSLKRCLERIIV
ncbi:MAG: dTDP-4-dehydrorhamnose reductase [Bacteroidales bacterium]|nr:dTDP-4-dehydrorhamnose reductase [Bacteroidales bacterium]